MEKQFSENHQIPNAKSSVFIWGMFFDKQHKYMVPTRVKQLEKEDITDVKSGGFFYLCLSRDGRLWGWGTTKHCKFGISGDDLHIPKQIPLKFKVSLIAAGNWHSIIVDEHGQSFGVGHNKYGSCGTGTFENQTAFTPMVLEEKIVKVAAGDGFSLLLNQKRELFSCGHRDLNGLKSKDHVSKPIKVAFQNPIVNFAAGFSHSLAVDSEGQLFSWGDGQFYQLGHGDKSSQRAPKKIVCHTTEGKSFVDVSCTRGEKYCHSMAVDTNGTMYTWGAGYKGKLGHEQEWDHSDAADEPRPRQVKEIPYRIANCRAGGIHSMVLNEDGQVLSFGCGSDHRLGHEESQNHKYLYREGKPRKIQALEGWCTHKLECSYYHNICLSSKRGVKSEAKQ